MFGHSRQIVGDVKDVDDTVDQSLFKAPTDNAEDWSTYTSDSSRGWREEFRNSALHIQSCEALTKRPSSQAELAASSSTKRVRRPLTSVACIACRTKHSKCNGARPTCSMCSSGRGRECVYDANPSDRKSTTLKAELKKCREELDPLRFIFKTLLSRTADESLELIGRFRTGSDLMVVARELRERLPSDPRGSVSKEITPRPDLTTTGLSQEKDSSNLLIAIIRKAAGDEVEEIVRHLQIGQDVASILQSIKAKSICSAPQQSAPNSDLEAISGLTANPMPSGLDSSNQQPRGPAIDFLLNTE